MKTQADISHSAGDIEVLLKIGRYFIQRSQIRSFSRFGKGTKITLVNDEEIVVNVGYDKVAGLVQGDKK